ncbi:YcbK family protein [Methylorubrum thiocyanatum]|uniref:YcbK family protein n=1 Tax=Methylorubrum thiocyanatum TaxID=47958 RepID=UPI003F82076A
MPVSRRSLLTGLVAAAAAPLAGLDPAYAAALAGTAGLPPPPRLWLRRERTGEEVSAILRTPAGANHPDLVMLSWLLRDVEDGSAAVWIDPRLFDLLAGIQGAMSHVHGAVVPLIVTSGYRTPRHNAGLEDAARSSLHLAGCAADVKAVGYGPGAVATAGALHARGGVGIYPSFCHLDVGRVRAWAGGSLTGARQPQPGTPIEPPRAAP